MNSRFTLLLLALSLVAATSGAVSKYNNEADHAMVITISTDPQGANVCSVPASTNEQPVVLGKTPYITVVDFNWQRGWFGKRWDRLQVSTPGNICRTEYTRKGGQYQVYMNFKVEEPGYEPVERDELVASFKKPEELDYDDIDFIASRRSVDISLTPTAAAQAAAAVSTTAAPPTVVVASANDSSGELGTVHVSVNVGDASVLVDGKPAGRAPVKLVLAAGEHNVEVNKPGYQSYSNNLSVRAHAEVALKVTLAEASKP